MLIPLQNDYSSRDFDSLRARLIELVKASFPDWTDFSVASFGNILLEMYAFVGDVLNYYQDNQARESRLSTATQRKNVIALASMLGYKLHGARAATVELLFSLKDVPSADVTIPKGTIVRTREVANPIRFQLLEDATIRAGAMPPRTTGIAEHSQVYTQLFDTRGLPSLDVILDHTPYLDGSAQLTAANGPYLAQENLLGSGPADRHFTVLVDQNDRATLRFGNGRNGAVPTGTIRVIYKTGGGALGNIDANQLVILDGAFLDAHGKPVQLSVTNSMAASGGINRQSIESVRILAPISLRTSNRSITREDFEINAKRLPEVARALMLTANEDRTIGENSGILFIVPQGGGMPTDKLKDAVYRQVSEIYPCPLTFQVSVQDPVYRVIHVDARIYVKQGYDPGLVARAIRENLGTYFQITLSNGTPNPNVDFGFNVKGTGISGEVAWSDIFNVIRDTAGVRKIGDQPGDLKLNGKQADLVLDPKEFPVLGMVRLTNGTTGEVLR